MCMLCECVYVFATLQIYAYYSVCANLSSLFFVAGWKKRGVQPAWSPLPCLPQGGGAVVLGRWRAFLPASSMWAEGLLMRLWRNSLVWLCLLLNVGAGCCLGCGVDGVGAVRGWGAGRSARQRMTPLALSHEGITCGAWGCAHRPAWAGRSTHAPASTIAGACECRCRGMRGPSQWHGRYGGAAQGN